MKCQLFVRGSLCIGGAIFSAGTFWSMGGSLLDGAAGAGATWVVGGLTGDKPWPVVVGGLFTVLPEGSLKAYAKAESNIAAPIIKPMKVLMRAPEGSRYRGGFRPNPGSGSFGSW
jgi:hypothetical protein